MPTSSVAISREQSIQAIRAVLNRDAELEPLAALAAATHAGRPRRSESPPADIAFGLDTNVLLNLGAAKATEVVDYLAAKHSGPLVLPGQVVQEFWNNTLAKILTAAQSIERKVNDLSKEIAGLSVELGPYKARFELLLQELIAEHGLTFDPNTVSRLENMFAILEKHATVPYVPRADFLPIANSRRLTKTPPGFRDDDHGDFYVWADFLLGLHRERAAGRLFEMAVLVTDDKKPDWSRDGEAQPILAAEVQLLLGVPFETWDLEHLGRYVHAVLGIDPGEDSTSDDDIQLPDQGTETPPTDG